MNAKDLLILSLIALLWSPIAASNGRTSFLDNRSIRLAVNDWIKDPAMAEAIFGPIRTWDTRRITDMSGLFHHAKYFNADLSQWNTSSVTTMRQLFYRATSFNADISMWQTDRVVDMSYTFGGAVSFNGPIGNWNVSRVESMKGIFYEAESFDQTLTWDVSSVTDLSNAFAYAYAYTGKGIQAWDVSSALSMDSMFHQATHFDQELCWEPHESVDLSNMFCGSSGKLNTTCTSTSILERLEPCYQQFIATITKKDGELDSRDKSAKRNTVFLLVSFLSACLLLVIVFYSPSLRVRQNQKPSTIYKPIRVNCSRSSDGNIFVLNHIPNPDEDRTIDSNLFSVALDDEYIDDEL